MRLDRPAVAQCGEPTWDMILDLYIADREGRRVDVSSLCLASGVAHTTANRYVNLLVDDELISKIGDADDGHRSFAISAQRCAKRSTSGWIRRKRN